MFEGITSFFKKIFKSEEQDTGDKSKNAAKERLHLVLMQDRANVSAHFLELMKQEIIDVIKKYIVVDENAIDVRLTNQANDDGTNGAPSLYANIPIVNIRNDVKAEKMKEEKEPKVKEKTEKIDENKDEDEEKIKEKPKKVKEEKQEEKKDDKKEDKQEIEDTQTKEEKE